MTLAILCSGQGNQHEDMFALTADAPEAADIFAIATRALGGRDPRDLVRAADKGAIHGNAIGQVLCCTQALAAFAALREALDPRRVVAGYSVGELASWGCAGLLPPDTVINLAVTRARLMDAASGPDDGLAFVRGLKREQLEPLCAARGTAIAIVNPGDLFVVGGAVADLDALCAAATETGAGKTGLLRVAVASHTPRLADAARGFRDALAEATVPKRPPPGMRLLSGIDGAMVLDVGRGLDKLAAQIAQPIDWAACLEACVEMGVDAMLELGPGTALSTMVAAAKPGIAARALDEFRGLDGVKAWLTRGR